MSNVSELVSRLRGHYEFLFYGLVNQCKTLCAIPVWVSLYSPDLSLTRPHCSLSGGGSGRAQQGRAAPGGAQNDAVPGEHFQPPGVHPGCPTVALEHQAFHHLPGRLFHTVGGHCETVTVKESSDLLHCYVCAPSSFLNSSFLPSEHSSSTSPVSCSVTSKRKDSSEGTAGAH